MTSPRIILSGGGTGGHIFPAVSIAQEIKSRFPDAQILFIGALGKMEMEKVPQAGFPIEGLEIAGFDRGNLLSNFSLPFMLLKSIRKARKIIKDFRPDFAVGTGGFASGPALWAASQMRVPIFIQEQNSLPGVTNKILSRKAKAVFTAYPEMERFFPKTKVEYLGNPIRKTLLNRDIKKEEAKNKFGLQEGLTILSVGGSQGSRTLNNAWESNLDKLSQKGYQLIWQTGSLDYPKLSKNQSIKEVKGISLKEFISDMAEAYAAADVIVSRAGAIAISELQMVGKPVLLVPLPTAAEDHQTKNAQKLVDKQAAFMVKDVEMKEKFWNTLEKICEDSQLRKETGENLKSLAKPNATQQIVDEIFKIVKIKES